MTDDRLLLQKAQEGDRTAFEALVTLHSPRVFHLALGYTGRHHDAEEITQTVFWKVWNALPQFRGGASFSTWLYRLTSNAAIDFLRREKRQSGPSDFSLDDEETYIEPVDPAPTPQRHAEAKELREALAQGLEKLSPEHRQVLLLRELQGLSYEEISDALDLDLGTVKSRIARAREKLRNYLLRSGNFSGYAPSNMAEKEG